MGRELRRVPANWEHPRKENGKYKPLLDASFADAAAEWKEAFAKWESGLRPVYRIGGAEEWLPIADVPPDDRTAIEEYWEYAGDPPDREYYRPDWEESERTHFQMYEDTSEGTPISPVFPAVEPLCRWLADTGASAFADMTATYDEWMATCLRGWAPGMIIETGESGSKIMSGVEGTATN